MEELEHVVRVRPGRMLLATRAAPSTACALTKLQQFEADLTTEEIGAVGAGVRREEVKDLRKKERALRETVTHNDIT